MGIGSLFSPPERRFTLQKSFFPVIGKCAQAWRYFGAERSRTLQAVFDKQATGENSEISEIKEIVVGGGVFISPATF